MWYQWIWNFFSISGMQYQNEYVTYWQLKVQLFQPRIVVEFSIRLCHLGYISSKKWNDITRKTVWYLLHFTMSYICKVVVTLCPPIARLFTHSMVFLSVARINPEKWLQRIKLWRFCGDTSARHRDKFIKIDCVFN